MSRGVSVADSRRKLRQSPSAYTSRRVLTLMQPGAGGAQSATAFGEDTKCAWADCADETRSHGKLLVSYLCFASMSIFVVCAGLCAKHQSCFHGGSGPCSLARLLEAKEIFRTIQHVLTSSDSVVRCAAMLFIMAAARQGHGLAVRVSWEMLLASYPRSIATEHW